MAPSLSQPGLRWRGSGPFVQRGRRDRVDGDNREVISAAKPGRNPRFPNKNRTLNVRGKRRRAAREATSFWWCPKETVRRSEQVHVRIAKKE